MVTLIIVPRPPNDGSVPSISSAEADPVTVLYEDEALLAIDKPAGLVIHPAYKHPSGTLVDAVFARQAARDEGRPWLLHRLDRETSGVVLFAKTVAARRALVRQFERRAVRKLYLAITIGVPTRTEGSVVAPLRRDPADRRRVIVAPDGQSAITHYAVLATGGDAALVLARPLTGRTHQIRAHLAHLGTPFAGDATYLPADVGDAVARVDAPRAMLHAWRLEVTYPGTGAQCVLTAPPPADFRATLEQLGLCTGLRYLLRLHQLPDSIAASM